MYRTIVLFGLILASMTSFSQDFWSPHRDNSTESAAKERNFNFDIKNAQEAYNQGDIKKAKYYLKQSRRSGWISSSYLYLRGRCFYDEKKYFKARKYWRTAYKKFSCWECNELVEKMKKGEPLFP